MNNFLYRLVQSLSEQFTVLISTVNEAIYLQHIRRKDRRGALEIFYHLKNKTGASKISNTESIERSWSERMITWIHPSQVPSSWISNIFSINSFLSSSPCLSASNLQANLNSSSPANLYFGIYGNSDLNTPSQWLQVTVCTSEIGSSAAPICQTGAVPDQANQCYVRLDIQVAYANIGEVSNPQPVLGAVVLHYQSIVSTDGGIFPKKICSLSLVGIIVHNVDGKWADHSDGHLSRYIKLTCHRRRPNTADKYSSSWWFLLPVFCESRGSLDWILFIALPFDHRCFISSVDEEVSKRIKIFCCVCFAY